jgi:hypothetical protein
MSHPALVSVESKLIEDRTSIRPLVNPFQQALYRWKVRLTFSDGSFLDVDDAEVLRQMRRCSTSWLDARKVGANVVPRDPLTAITKEDREEK